MDIVVGTDALTLEPDEVATLDAELRRRDHDSHAGQRLREALERGDPQATLRDSELGELALALHGLSDSGVLSDRLERLREAVSGYFAGLEHGS